MATESVPFASPAAIGLFLGALLALCAIFTWLWMRQRRRYLGLSALFYGMLAASYASPLFLAPDPGSPEICGICAGMVIAMLLTLMAVADFTERKLRPFWIWACLGTLGLLALGSLVKGFLDGFTARSLVAHAFILPAGIQSALFLWRHGAGKAMEYRLCAGISLACHTHSSLHPFIPFLGSYARPGWFVESTLVTLTGTAFLLCHFQRLGEELAELVKQREALRKRADETRRLEGLSVLAGGVAHDFNNLLAAILGSADLAAMDVAPESRTARDLDRIRRSALRAGELTRQLLASSGQGEFHLLPLDLSRLVESSLHLVELSDGFRSPVQLRKPAPPAPIEGDEGHLRGLLLSLLHNADEAQARVGRFPPIEVGIDEKVVNEAELEAPGRPERTAAGRYLRVAIRDHGEGMDEETAIRAFDPFFTTRFTGRGLGLSAAAGIARRHGGFLRLEGVLGKGCTASLYLPLGSAAMADAHPEGREAERSTGCLLLVEDDDDLREVFRSQIEEEGWAVLDAPNGRKALELLDTHPEIELILLDWKMPVLSGEGVLEELQARKIDLPVILMSGFSEGDATPLLGKAPNVRAFLQKPFERSALTRLLRDRK